MDNEQMHIIKIHGETFETYCGLDHVNDADEVGEASVYPEYSDCDPCTDLYFDDQDGLPWWD